MNNLSYEKMLDALAALKLEKPNDRSEKDRRYAVAITELEKVIAYYYTYIENDEA